MRGQCRATVPELVTIHPPPHLTQLEFPFPRPQRQMHKVLHRTHQDKKFKISRDAALRLPTGSAVQSEWCSIPMQWGPFAAPCSPTQAGSNRKPPPPPPWVPLRRWLARSRLSRVSGGAQGASAARVDPGSSELKPPPYPRPTRRPGEISRKRSRGCFWPGGRLGTWHRAY